MESAAATCHDHLYLEIIRIRNRAIRALMTEHGLGLDQIMDVSLSDIDLAQKRLGVKRGSKSDPRYFTLSSDTASALAHYLRVRSPSEEKKLFLSEHSSGRSCALTSAIGWQSFC